MKMRNDVAVFILTHGRVNEQISLETLKSLGYTGNIYLIVDDMDEQMAEYQRKYGDKVKVFSKQETPFDTFTNKTEWRSVTYARNAAYKIARELGLKYIFVMDDDISGLTIRVVRNGSLKGFKIGNINQLLNEIADYMEKANITVFGFSQSGAFIGGKDGQKYKAGCQRTVSQAMMVSVDDPIEWRCLFGQDLHGSLDGAEKGKVFLSTMLVAIQSPQRSTNSGGLHDVYKETQMYTTLFYSVIGWPSVVSLTNKDGEWKHRINRGRIAPMIVSDKYRKVG